MVENYYAYQVITILFLSVLLKNSIKISIM